MASFDELANYQRIFFKIANYLPDKDLLAMFVLNRKIYNMYNNSKYCEYFWMDRSKTHFKGTSERNYEEHKQIKERLELSWKDYYVKVIHTHNKYINAKMYIYDAAMHSIEEGNLIFLKYLVPIYYFAGNVGHTENLLMYKAVKYGHLEVAKYFHRLGYDIKQSYDNLLHLSIRKGHFEIANYLVENGAPVDEAFLEGASCSLEFMKYLMEKGFEPNEDDIVKAMRHAAYCGPLETVEFLVKISENLSEVLLKTGFDSAVQGGHLDIVKYLHSLGAKISFVTAVGKDECSLMGYYEVLKYLIDNGLTIDNDIIDSARESRNVELVDYLLRTLEKQAAEQMAE